jgi:hypothetical protein
MEIYIEEVLFIQQLLDISVRFGNFNANIENTIKDGYTSLLEEMVYSNDNIEKYLEKIKIQRWMNNSERWLDITWFNDASASVVQLLVIKLLSSNTFTLKISNILNNDTEYKDIYKYIEDSVCKKNESLRRWVSRTIVKRIIMPGIYGQKIPKMIKECEDILKKNKDWELLDHGSRKDIILEINKNCWEVLNEIGLDVLKYLKLTKRLAIKRRIYYWRSMIGIPIIIGRSLELNRRKILNKLAQGRDTLSEKSITRLKEKLNIDDKNYHRKNIKIGGNWLNKRYIKIRLKTKSKIIDLNALVNSLCPSSIHSEDASILIKIINECSDYGIGIIPIHDSIGSKIYFSSIIKSMYKKKFIEYIDYVLSEKEFPINSIILENLDKNFEKDREIKRNDFIKIKEEIVKGIIISNNIFN